MPDDIQSWFTSHVPSGWFSKAPEVSYDGEEILVVGGLKIDPGSRDAGVTIETFRESSRDQRMKIAHDAERLFRRKVAWGATCAGETRLFTTLSVPVMTRLRMPERAILDTLVAGGVARSRSEALAWCVKLVGMHQSDWIQGLRDALVKVDEIRKRGPA